jgi:TATA-box binding protein (TBP) (component of TFIID and TFIIIB)
MSVCHLESSIIDMFKTKLIENIYLNEIAEYFIESNDMNNEPVFSDDLLELEKNITISPIRISTMTVLCNLGVIINLDTFYKHIQTYHNVEKNYKIVSLEYMENPAKGVPKQKKKKQSQANAKLLKKRKSFYNQATVIMDYIKTINLKLFRNGSIHITGIIDVEQGKRAVEFLCDEIREIYKIDNTITNGDINELGLANWDVVMINSDFCCNFKIRREKLYEILDSRYNLVVNYESDNYPGVKTSFYWNVRDPSKSGVCKCKIGKTCSGKGRGTLAEGDTCRKITISIFQSGKIIITGARDKKQIDDAYDFITNIFREYFHSVARLI